MALLRVWVRTVDSKVPPRCTQCKETDMCDMCDVEISSSMEAHHFEDISVEPS